MKFVVDITVNHKHFTTPLDLADALVDYLCDGGAGNVEYPEAILSVNGVEHDWKADQ